MGQFSSGWRWRELAGFVVATVLIFALWQLPYAFWLVYPFRLFGTFVHELSHGLAAIATGGSFKRFVVNSDLSGMAWSAGGIRLIVASAGYIGSAVFGAVLVLLAARGVPSRWLLAFIGAGLALACVLLVRNAFGLASGLGLAAALLLAAWRLPQSWRDGLLMLLAIQALLDGFNSLIGVFRISGRGEVHTDADTLAQLTGLPAGVWVVLWSLLSAWVLWWCLRWAFRHPAPH